MFSEAHHIANEIGEKLAQTEVLSRLGECKSAMGRGPEAVEHLLEAISLASQLGNRLGLSECYRRLSEVHFGMADAQQAIDCARRALKIAEEIGSRALIGNAHRVMAEALGASGSADAVRADEHFRFAITILAEVRNQLDLARVYRAYASFQERNGQPEEAAKLRKHADEIFNRLRGAAAAE
jgi:tetratricopeptide (TPR) repeat protein